jgi:hypothetical protein
MAGARLTLSLSANIPDERIARLTRELGRDLSREGLTAHTPEPPAVPGERGEPVTLGLLALALLTSGTVKALIGCLKAYVSREPSLIIRLRRADGAEMEVNARNVNEPGLRAALAKVTLQFDESADGATN